VRKQCDPAIDDREPFTDTAISHMHSPATVEGDKEAELKERPLKQTARRQHNTADGSHRLRQKL